MFPLEYGKMGFDSGEKGEENTIILTDVIKNRSGNSNDDVIYKMIKKIPSIDTSTWTSTVALFNSCNNLEEIPPLDTSNVTMMGNMFANCKKITTIPQLDTSNVASTSNMFYYCDSLKTVPELDGGKMRIITSMFESCSALVNLGGLKNLGKAYTQKTIHYNDYKLDLSRCFNLSHDSLMNVINKLYDLNISYNVAGGGTLYRQWLKLGSVNLEKLTEEEIAIATNKGWDVIV